MTEPIMINGVDVSKCGFLDKTLCRGLVERYNKCECCPDCYYKQLQRKTAECEKLKNKCNLREGELNQIKLLLEGKNTQYNQLQAECEELKADYEPLLDSKVIAEVMCEALKDKLQIATEALKKIRLEEIETFDMTESEYETEVHDTEFSKTLTWCEEALERIKE